MNCDQVFDALTRGPFPTGNDALDERVERHLGHCGSCRRLAAALQPAVELFEEAVPPEESCGLPAYWGELFSRGDAQPTTRTRAPRLLRRMADARPRGQRTAIRLEHAWRIAAALLVGMAIGGVMRAALQEPDQPSTLVASADRDDFKQSAKWALGMTGACGPMAAMTSTRPRSHAESSAKTEHGDVVAHSDLAVAASNETSLYEALELARQKCCTECHRSGGTVLVAASARARIASSCELCHAESPTVLNAASMGGGD